MGGVLSPLRVPMRRHDPRRGAMMHDPTSGGAHGGAQAGDAQSAAHERLTAADLGLPPDGRSPLHFTPGQHWSPVVVSLPHVGLKWPHDLRPKPQADVARNADYEVQTLYRTVAALGVARIEAIYSRLVVDLNRAGDDVSRALVPDHPAPRPRRSPGEPSSVHPDAHEPERPGRGVVWTTAVGNVRVLSKPLRYADFQRRIDRYHTPYYRALKVLLERRRRRFGFAILLDAHSMPSSVGVDLIAGTLAGRSCHPAIADRAVAALRLEGKETPGVRTVRRDDPYRGGEVVRVFGRPHDGVHALQLEVSRDLYMDETSMRLHEDALRDAPAMRSALPGLSVNTHAVHPTWPSGTSGQPIREAQTPSVDASGSSSMPTRLARHARDLADVRRRVTCLVASLAEVTHETLGIDPPQRDDSGADHSGPVPRRDHVPHTDRDPAGMSDATSDPAVDPKLGMGHDG